MSTCSKCNPQSKKPFYKNKSIIITTIIAFIIIVSNFIDILIPLKNSLVMFFHQIWFAIILGFLLGGAIEYFVPKEYVSILLANKSKRTILKAVFAGFLMSACSHGILAIAIQLYKKGASTSSVVAFLLASPWANIALTVILISFFGVIKGLYIIFSAIIIAIVTGIIFQLLESKSIVERNNNTVKVQENFSIISDLKSRLKQKKYDKKFFFSTFQGVIKGSISLADMVLWWILLGMLFASLISAYIPNSFFDIYLGPTFSGLIVTLVIATFIEVCSEGSAPIALEIYNKTRAIGNSFVFLMAGVVTDYTEIGLLWTNVGKKTAILLPIITVPQVIFFGIIANWIFG
jgi:uncharacterized protein